MFNVSNTKYTLITRFDEKYIYIFFHCYVVEHNFPTL